MYYTEKRKMIECEESDLLTIAIVIGYTFPNRKKLNQQIFRFQL